MSANRLLVVDDDAATRWALRAIFTRRGWQVIVAENVAEGIAALDPAPRCVILDLNLPDGGGETILRTISARGLSSRVAVLSQGRLSAPMERPFDVGKLGLMMAAAGTPA